MIVNKKSYLFVEDKLKRVSNILYDDLIKIGSDFLLANGFDNTSECLEVRTAFKTIYLRETQSLYFKDFLTNSFEKSYANTLYAEDEILFPLSLPNYSTDKFNVQDFLYLDSYDYSVAYSDIINKYKLPKAYLLTALTTGCPDDLFNDDGEFNKRLQTILKDLKLESEEEFRDYLLNKYSNVIKRSKQKYKISKGLLDLVYTCINGNYTILSHTSLELYVYNSEMFANIVSFLSSYNINKTITNSIFNKRDCSIISINSSFIYNLLKTEFNNFEFLLKLSKKDSEYLISILNDNFYNLKSDLSGYYLQEFLYNHSKLYCLDETLLTKVIDYQVTPNGFLVPVKNVTKVFSNDFVDITLYKNE